MKAAQQVWSARRHFFGVRRLTADFAIATAPTRRIVAAVKYLSACGVAF